MGNTLGTTPGVLIARRMLDTLLEDFPFLKQITTDFSDEVGVYGQPLSIKIPNTLEADDYDGDGDGYEPQDVSQTDVPLTINKHKHVTYAFNDTERSSHDIMLVERFARNGAHAIGKQLVDDLLALVLNAAFPNKTEEDPTTFDVDDVGEVRGSLNARKVPLSGRFMLLNSAFYKNLTKDLTLIANAGSPAGTVRTGQVGDVHGFDVQEYPFMPANGEKLGGIAGTAEGLIIATRVPTMPDAKALGGGHVEVVTHPDTKLSIQVRSWYDWKAGKEFRCYTLMYGVAKGNAACLERIVEP